jgi:anthranilate phosphoribosyltransferase
VGLAPAADSALPAGTPDQNARVLRDVLGGQPGTERSLAIFNAGAAIYVGGLADSLAAGVARAQEAVDSGAASGVLDAYVERAQ